MFKLNWLYICFSSEIREIFSLFDKDCDGRIATSELGPVLRSVGLNPTEEEILELVHYYDKNRECVTIRK